MLLKNILFLLVCIWIFQSCSSFKKRNPASYETETELGLLFLRVDENLKYVSLNSEKCSEEYQSVYQDLIAIAGANYFDFEDTTLIEEKIKKSFELRLKLKDSLTHFENNNLNDHKCYDSVLNVFKSLRYIEDYLVEMYYEKSTKTNQEFVNLKGSFPYLLVNPKYENDFKDYTDLKSGDVLLSRGNAYSSAAIARIGISDYQFSHLSFVYRDQDTKEMFTTEAHIEIGSVTAPFQTHLDEKNARTVAFRFNDSKIAHLASKSIFDRVKKAQESGKNVLYDFSMNYKDDSMLFCSEIISSGFKKAMPNEEYIPKFKSHFTKGMIPFLNDIGIPANSNNITSLDVFAPGDIQFDPRFDLVAEWRNPKKMEESRFKDFILTKLFEKMDQDGYRIDPNIKMDVQSRTFWLLRRTPIVRKFLEKKFPTNMSPTQLEIFMALDKIGESLFKEIEQKSIDFDHPMTPSEIYTTIDEFIKKDFERYQKYKKGLDVQKPSFHLLFHP